VSRPVAGVRGAGALPQGRSRSAAMAGAAATRHGVDPALTAVARRLAAAAMRRPARAACPLAATARSVAPIAIPRGRRAVGPLASALRTQRRERIPWRLLPRPRLAAAWSAVQRQHVGGAGELSLVGVYGPVPLGAVQGVALDRDDRLAVTLARQTRPVVPGDIAIARVEPGRRLVRCDLPYPAAGRSVHATR
jgi:hypothetical protein